MPRKANRTFYLSDDVFVRFKSLVESTGISLNQCLERVMKEAINLGEIPGIRPVERQERRENSKWGNATPIYDAGREVTVPKDGKQGQRRRVGST